MSSQLNLFGIDPPSPPRRSEPSKKHQLFCAIQPPAEATSHALDIRNSLCRDDGLRGTAVAGSRLHATLHPFGHFDALQKDYIDLLCRLLSTVEQKPFLVTFDLVKSYASLVLVPSVKNEALKALSRAIGRAVDFKGNWTFSPHITLLYTQQKIADRRIDPISWTVNEFVLIDSIQGETTHNLIKRFPLRA
jgi:2'-5' RNA ligase